MPVRQRKLGLVMPTSGYTVASMPPQRCQGTQCVGSNIVGPGRIPVPLNYRGPSSPLPTPTTTAIPVVTSSAAAVAVASPATGDDPQCVAAGEVGGPYPNCTYAIAGYAWYWWAAAAGVLMFLMRRK